MSAHSVLSPSGADRWMECSPSALLEQEVPNKSNIYAEAGTAAHDLAEYKLKTALKIESTQKPVSEFDSQEMEEFTDIYVEFCLNLIENCQEPQILIEQRLDLNDYVPGGFGTADLIVVDNDVLHVVDFKFGAIVVSAEKNPQMMLYALGALPIYEILYDIKKVSMTIIQPRRDNFSTFEMSAHELLKWAEEVLKPKAVMASKGEGELKSGEHCRSCRVKVKCRARAEKNLEQAKYDFAAPPLLSDDEIAEIISVADELSKWANDIYTYATALAINEGKQWPGFKLVQGRTRRKYSDEKLVAKKAKEAGYSDIYKQSLLTITQMEKLMGKKNFNEILGSLIDKPKGKLTLVSETDKRQAIDPVSVDFKVE